MIQARLSAVESRVRRIEIYSIIAAASGIWKLAVILFTGSH